ncbi:MAG: TolC family protein, partial [Oricola sp.]|nr:TolC family protein [Oricola sp.]
YGRGRVRYDALAAAAAKARQAADLARQRYDVGADDFLMVLDTEGRLLAAEASLAASQTSVTVDFIRVYQALGAGWSVDLNSRTNDQQL